MSKKMHVVNDDRDPIEIAMSQLHDDAQTRKIKAKFDEHQRAFYEGTKERRVSIADAKAGTGKTTVSFVSGIESLRSPQFSKLMYIRFVDDLSQSLGFLPGNLGEKQAPYFKPAFQSMEKCGLQRDAIEALMQREVIELTTHVHLRGTDYENVFVIIDEAQNARDMEALRLVLTRFHDSCRIVLIGHGGQVDSKLHKIKGYTPFELYQLHLLKKKWVRRYELLVDYRGELCRHADSIGDTIAEITPKM